MEDAPGQPNEKTIIATALGRNAHAFAGPRALLAGGQDAVSLRLRPKRARKTERDVLDPARLTKNVGVLRTPTVCAALQVFPDALQVDVIVPSLR